MEVGSHRETGWLAECKLLVSMMWPNDTCFISFILLSSKEVSIKMPVSLPSGVDTRYVGSTQRVRLKLPAGAWVRDYLLEEYG